ncbi:nucleoid-associated protein YgaU [Sagittula marina]|uniref:Nucleoid-associated protein YgaU n=1 Tax=Sagittula marina TaxID=943940 RepID=A0A7W6DQ25_9RHOB|nr:LysM peptidoglycan-binding domain-containing protein [Sagittula marina]MBB3983923.1 nucleoid-associated protein YgaU [Sagittula marina]
MIRMVLFALGFLAITLTLLVLQPGAQKSANDPTSGQVAVTRAQPALTAVETDLEDAVAAALTRQGIADSAPEPEVARVAPATRSPLPSAVVPVDDQELRRMTWETLSSLNHATGRDSAPGQPGSLLHTIVRRSLDGTSAKGSTAESGVYVVQSGDSLVSIAERIYGDVNMTGPLFAANQAILSRPDDLRTGQTLVLPER